MTTWPGGAERLPFHNEVDPFARVAVVADLIREMFEYYAREIWYECSEDMLNPAALIGSRFESGSFITYHTRCCRVVEILGLLTLLLEAQGDALSASVGEYLAGSADAQPGAAHPISDKWAISCIAPAVALFRKNPKTAEAYLRRVSEWVTARYIDRGVGMAASDATPSREVEHLLGGPLEHISVARRRESYAAAVILDVAAVLELTSVYEESRLAFMTADIVPQVIIAGDDISQYLAADHPDATSLSLEVNPPYLPAAEAGADWTAAPHQRFAAPHLLDRLGRSWDLLAISSVVRDRHYLCSIRRLAGFSQ